MKNYEINSNTLALIPIEKNKTAIYENHDCYIIEEKITKIMDNSCRYYDSSMEGRLKGTLTLTGISYKAPIIVAEDKNIIFFPTSSLRLNDCSWISSNNIKNIYLRHDKCIVEFVNNETIEFNVSYNIMNNQLLRSLKLESAIRKRKNE